MKIVSVIGARPQFVKAAAVSRVIRSTASVTEVLVHTGQHYDANMSDVFFTELSIPQPDYNLEVGSGSHAYQTGMMMMRLEEVLLREKPDWTLVYGDTNSTVAGSLASVKLHIPVAHVEAGLRSFNRAMPEEINRIITDRISDLLFAPTGTAIRNLGNEGLAGITMFSGDVMYDSILFYRDIVAGDPRKYHIDGRPAEYCLATIHRAENTDDRARLEQILQAFGRTGIPIIFPVHPRTRKVIGSMAGLPSNVILIDPVGYLHMIRLTMDAKKVLTDSGGLQKEAYFLGTPCVTLRGETEWAETLHDGWNTVTGTDPDAILAAVDSPMPSAPRRNDFGDGKAAEKIVGRLTA
jgi:UDP-GlcNAc3NAcA epimerase